MDKYIVFDFGKASDLTRHGGTLPPEDNASGGLLL